LAYFRLHGDIPKINGIVDVYNAISVRSGVAMGAHDLRNVTGDIELRLTVGNETFWPLGAQDAVRIAPAEYAYVDSNNDVLCRLEARQVEKTKISLESRDAFFIVQAHDATGMNIIEAAANDLQHACLELFGGEVEELDGIPV
jgi:DNA/RNA-binding domain of Phe-tRNA-synthetase-like protein